MSSIFWYSRRKPAFALAITIVIMFGLWYVNTFHRSSTDPDVIYQLAVAAVAADDFQSARRYIFQLRFISGQQHRVDLLQGTMDLKRGLLQDAARELASAAAVPETRLEALALFGEACYHLGLHTQTQQALTEVLRRDPQRTESRRWLAASYYDIGAMQLAIHELEILSTQLPQDGRPARLKALIQKDFEQFQEAIVDYQESLRRDPEAADREQILLELAECHLRLHQYDEALQTITMAVTSSAALTIQAECQIALNREQEAIRSLEKALQLDTQNGRALILQAQFQDDQGNLQEAAELLRRAVAADPHEHQSRLLLATIHRRLGQTAEADLQAAEGLRLQQLREKFSQMHDTAILDTQDAQLRFDLGQTAMQLGKTDLARTWFQAALALDPAHKESREAIQGIADSVRSQL